MPDKIVELCNDLYNFYKNSNELPYKNLTNRYRWYNYVTGKFWIGDVKSAIALGIQVDETNL